ncbi:MAG: FkbM family methyltransferase [Gammaproteobacteria bacterium]
MPSRFIWRALKTRYRDQRAELAAIKESIRPDSIAIDVGANKGSYLYWMARWTPAGRTVAFEPQEELARYLEAVAAKLHLNNVVVEDKGVSDQAGQLTFHIPDGSVMPGASFSQAVADREECAHTTKEVVTLDDYFPPDASISVMKVDVEGFELHVFRGASRILEKSAPLLVFECEGRHLEQGTVADVLRYLNERGYDGHFVRRNCLVPACDFDPAIHQKEVGEKFYADKDYCNNFVFRRTN